MHISWLYALAIFLGVNYGNNKSLVYIHIVYESFEYMLENSDYFDQVIKSILNKYNWNGKLFYEKPFVGGKSFS